MPHGALSTGNIVKWQSSHLARWIPGNVVTWHSVNWQRVAWQLVTWQIDTCQIAAGKVIHGNLTTIYNILRKFFLNINYTTARSNLCDINGITFWPRISSSFDFYAQLWGNLFLFGYIQGVPWTMTVVNSFECLLSHTVLDIKDFLQFISLKKCLLINILLWNQFYNNKTVI